MQRPTWGLFRQSRKSFELLRGLLAQFQPLYIGRELIGKLLTAGLDGKILLRVGDFRLAWITVLGDEVTSETGELVVSYLTHTA